MTSARRIAVLMLTAFAAAALCACANIMPVPGGTDSANARYFQSEADMKHRIGELQVGMPEAGAFAALGRKREDFMTLDAEEIWRAGLALGIIPLQKAAGSDNTGVLSGYKLRYKTVTRQHGLASPVRIETDENGFDYELTLLFRDGRLMAGPILSGGAVSEVRSRTLFDYLSPATALSYARH